jgi:hypothetical protein
MVQAEKVALITLTGWLRLDAVDDGVEPFRG